MRSIAMVLALVLAAPSFAEGIEVSDPFARLSRPGAPSGAVFLSLRNTSELPDRLLSAASPVAIVVQLHSHMDDNGVMKMRQIENGISLPPGTSHHLVRGGDHVMLMGITRELRDGDTLLLTLTFERAGEITLTVPIDNTRGQEKRP